MTAIAQKYFAMVPDDAAADRSLAAAEPVEDLERALREADRTAAFGQCGFLVH